MSLRYRDLGLLTALPCPMCDASKLHLQRVESGSIFMRLLKVGEHWRMHCRGCTHAISIDDDESARCLELVDITAAMLHRQITADQYLDELRRLDLRCMVELTEQGKTWACPTCNEANPTTFHHCWSCDALNPDAPPAPELDPDAPHAVAPDPAANLAQLIQRNANANDPFGQCLADIHRLQAERDAYRASHPDPDDDDTAQ